MGNLRHLCEFRGEAGELEIGRRAEGRRRVREGRDREGRRRLEGQGLRRARSSATTSTAGPCRTAPTTSARPARSAPPPIPARVFKGIRGPGPDGQQARHPARPRGRGRARRREPAVRPRLRAGRRRAASSRSGRTPDGRAAGAVHRQEQGKLALDEGVFGERFHGPLVHEAVRAELAARRRGTASTKTRAEVAMTGAKAWRQKGTGRARVGALSVAAAHRRRRGLRARSRAPTRSRSTARRQRRALRAALALHAERGSIAGVDAARLGRALHQAGRRGAGARSTARARVLVVLAEGEESCAKSFRNIAGRDRSRRRPGGRGRRGRRRPPRGLRGRRSSASPRRRARREAEEAE